MIRKLLVLLVLILALTACGSKKEPTATPLPPTDKPNTPTTPAVSATAPPETSPTLTTPSAPPPIAQEGLFISEVLPGIPSVDNNQEFIELYNAGNKTVNLEGWTLWYQMDDKKPEALVYTWEERAEIPPLGHYLLTRAEQDIGQVGDAQYELPLFEKRGGLALRDPHSQTIDSLVWGEGPGDYQVGAPAAIPQGGASLERRPGGEQGNAGNSGDHAADFALVSPNPQNSGDPIAPLPEQRLTIRLGLPPSVEPGSELDYTIEIQNQTDGPVHNVQVAAPLPPDFVVLELPTGAEQSDGWVEWGIKELASGATAIGVVKLQSPWTYLDTLISGYYVEASDWELRSYGPLMPFAVQGGAIPIATARTLDGKTVTIEGIATMYTGGFYAGGDGAKFYLEDETGGIQVYCPGGAGQIEVQLGDQVRVSGQIEIYRDALEIIPAAYPDDVQVLTTGDPPQPDLVALPAAASDESIVGRLLQITGTTTRIQEFSYSYEVDLMDEQGTLLLTYIEKDTGFSVEPLEVGQIYRVTGISEVYDGQRQLKPRLQIDFAQIFPPVLMLDMQGPNSALPGETILYTLTVYNHTGAPLTNVEVAATPPIENVFVEQVLDDGEQQGATVVWTLPELAGDGGSAVLRYRASVSEQASGRFVAQGASALADEWLDLAATEPLVTFVGNGVPVWAIQGEGDESPYVRGWASTEGIVIGVFAELDGFWIQSPEPDGDPDTSDGLFVLAEELEIGVALGDLVQLRGKVREQSGQTMLHVLNPQDVTIVSLGNDLPPALEFDPPRDQDQARPYLEAREGMLVQVSKAALAVAPTSKYGEAVLLRAKWGVERVMQGDPTGWLIFVDDGSPATHYDRSTLPFVIQSGDTVANVLGPLAYTYENYKIEPISTPAITPSERITSQVQALAENQFSIATFNAENLFDFRNPHPSDPPQPSVAEYRLHLSKAANAILAMGAPTIVGFQEVENIEVLTNLADQKEIAEFEYEPVLIEGFDSRGIDVGYLVRSDQATIEGAASYPAPEGLSSRPPLLITVTVHLTEDVTVHVFNNHFTSMGGGEAATEPRRTAQAEWNVSLVERLLAEEADAFVVVLGDLNSYYASPPLDALRKGGLRHVYQLVEPQLPYSYIYQGESESLDHILLTPALYEYLIGIEAVHINADYPPPAPDDPSAQRSSDHDPVVAIFEFEW